MSCTCFLGHPPCGWCEDSWECQSCGRMCNPDDDINAECTDCGVSKWYEPPVVPERSSLYFKGRQVPLTVAPVPAMKKLCDKPA